MLVAPLSSPPFEQMCKRVMRISFCARTQLPAAAKRKAQVVAEVAAAAAAAETMAAAVHCSTEALLQWRSPTPHSSHSSEMGGRQW